VVRETDQGVSTMKDETALLYTTKGKGNILFFFCSQFQMGMELSTVVKILLSLAAFLSGAVQNELGYSLERNVSHPMITM
jgi:hypothetical protein